jgi:hypothetical protein
MSNLVFVSGDFCSGSTLVFTLFRKTGEYHCLYEPLHERLPEYLFWRLPVYKHHFFVDDYFSEYKGFDKIPILFDPKWGNSELFLPPEAEADELYRYLSYLIETAFGRRDKVVLQFNRATFRLGWLRAKFPEAKVVHIYRDKEAQWNSMVRRGQEHLGREDIGQGDVTFQGFNIAAWCEDLKHRFPELDANNFRTGYERFCKLWELSYAQNRSYADLSVGYWDLTHDFEATCRKIWDCVGCESDIAALKQYVVPPEKQKPVAAQGAAPWRTTQNLVDRAGRRYARFRVQLRRRGLPKSC